MLDSSAFEDVDLPLPFEKVRPPLTQEISFTLSPAYRNDGGGLGTFVHDQTTGFGYEFQASVGPAPNDFLFVTIFTNYNGPADPDIWGPDSVNVIRTDYFAPWPPGLTFTIRLTIDAAFVPHLYVDGVEVLLAGSPGTPYALPNGDRAVLYGYSLAPGNTVDVTNLVIRNGVIVPPTPV